MKLLISLIFNEMLDKTFQFGYFEESMTDYCAIMTRFYYQRICFTAEPIVILTPKKTFRHSMTRQLLDLTCINYLG